MPKGIVFVFSLLMVCILQMKTSADFIVTVDPTDLTFTGPGTHSVDLFLSFEATGVDTDPLIDGLQIDITNAPNATLQHGAVLTAWTAGTADVNAGNRLSIASLNIQSFSPFVNGFDVPAAPERVHTATLTFDVLDDQDFTIGLSFVEATRSAVAFDGGAAGATGIVTMPTSFKVSAVPEPSSFAVLTSIGLVAAAVRRRRKRKV